MFASLFHKDNINISVYLGLTLLEIPNRTGCLHAIALRISQTRQQVTCLCSPLFIPCLNTWLSQWAPCKTEHLHSAQRHLYAQRQSCPAPPFLQGLLFLYLGAQGSETFWKNRYMFRKPWKNNHLLQKTRNHDSEYFHSVHWECMLLKTVSPALFSFFLFFWKVSILHQHMMEINSCLFAWYILLYTWRTYRILF